LELEPVLMFRPEGRLQRNSRSLPLSLPLMVQAPFSPAAISTVDVDKLAFAALADDTGKMKTPSVITMVSNRTIDKTGRKVNCLVCGAESPTSSARFAQRLDTNMMLSS
jgi:hypothetical protein